MITGSMKFFERSKARHPLGVRASASGGISANNVLSENRFSNWESSPSDDTITEMLVITFPNAVRANRLLLINHNFKDFNISFNLDAGNNDPTITDINNNNVNLTNGIYTIDDNNLNTSYFAFNSIAFTQITINIHTTLIKDQNKFLNQLIVTDEIGTFVGYPEIKKISFNMNESRVKTKAGPSFVNKQLRTLADLTLNFKNYTKEIDIELANNLFIREQDFLFWISGGNQKFRYALRGFRLDDLFKMQAVKGFSTGYSYGSYQGLMQAQLRLTEST